MARGARPEVASRVTLSAMSLPTPAQLAPAIAALFPAGVVVADLREPGNPDLLLPGEGEHLARAAPKRVREFAAGRACARRAMAELGIAPEALKVGQGRQPLWPSGFTGSITHTDDYCAAAVAPRTIAGALGIDTEIVGDVKADLWPSICTRAEMDRLEALPQRWRAIGATLIFSAKEAFYKSQYPLTGEFLGFHDVEVEGWHDPQDLESLDGGGMGESFVRPTRSIAFERHAAAPFRARHRVIGRHLICGIATLA